MTLSSNGYILSIGAGHNSEYGFEIGQNVIAYFGEIHPSIIKKLDLKIESMLEDSGSYEKLESLS